MGNRYINYAMPGEPIAHGTGSKRLRCPGYPATLGEYNGYITFAFLRFSMPKVGPKVTSGY